MTFSIVAHDATARAWGVAAASRALAVGSAVGAARAGVGALATQAMVNMAYRADGLRLLESGTSASSALDALVAADQDRADRQAAVVDASGSAASFTGDRCFPWAGGVTGDGFAIQGNLLAGPRVVERMRTAYTGTAGEPLARRLLAALFAGDEAGGDRRGRQSATLLVVSEAGGFGPGTDVWADLRVDDDPRPLAELGRLLELHELYYDAPDPTTLVPLAGASAAEVRGCLTRLGHQGPDLEAELTTWATVANLEGRLVPGQLDARLLAELRRHAETTT